MKIVKLPKQFLESETDATVEGVAEQLNLKNYSVVARGEYKLIVGLSGAGNRVIGLITKYTLHSDETSLNFLIDQGFSELDAGLAIGLGKNDIRRMRRRNRAQLKEAFKRHSVSTGRISYSTTSLDDL